MPVDSLHPEYTAMQDVWQRCRDVLEGEDAVKRAGTRYLPKLSGQKTYTSATGEFVNEYENYKMRAVFYEATARTVQGLMGGLFRKAPVFQVPAAMAPHLDDLTLTGIPATAFAETIAHEVIALGRYGVLVDADPSETVLPRPRWCGYPAERITNWFVLALDGIPTTTLVVLKERVVQTTSDPFVPTWADQYRVCSLDDEGFYQVDLWRQGAAGSIFSIQESYAPHIRGQRWRQIPFVFFAPTHLTPEVSRPLIQGLVSVNLSHYRTSADLEHGRHFCGLPTPWVAGFPTDTELKIGSAIAWVTDNHQARAGMLEFTGQGLGALEKALEEKEAKMAALGARLLESPRQGIEAADTIRLRTQGEQNILLSVAQTTSLGLTTLLQHHARWLSLDAAAVAAEINRDFVSLRLGGPELDALVRSWQAGALSRPSLLWNLRQGELLEPGITIEEEAARLDAEAPLTLPLSIGDEEDAA